MNVQNNIRLNVFKKSLCGEWFENDINVNVVSLNYSRERHTKCC